MRSTASTPHALVIGGSIGGLSAALLLRQRGFRVSIHERTPQELSGRGAGIVTHRELWDVLAKLGDATLRDDGVALSRRVVLEQDGRIVTDRVFPQVMTSWDRLFRHLRRLWGDDTYVLGHEVERVSQSEASVFAHFTDGSRVEADLLVAADGFRSTVRAQCNGDLSPLYAGYVGWRGMVDEAAMPDAVHRELFDIFSFGLPPGEQFVGYPVAGENDDLRPGHRRYNYVWYRPVDEAVGLPDILTDVNGHTHVLSIPPPLVRPELIARMRVDADRMLAPQLAAIIRATQAPFLQPIYDLEAPSMGFGRIALVGDAAFVARPHLGAGVTKAVQDGLALADALVADADIASAIERFSAERVPAGRRLVQRGRHLGAYMQAHLADDEQRAAASRHHSPAAVLEETASLAF